jgi:hypothetical protein
LEAAVGGVVVCACAETPVAMHINVAASIGLMTSPGPLQKSQ